MRVFRISWRRPRLVLPWPVSAEGWARYSSPAFPAAPPVPCGSHHRGSSEVVRPTGRSSRTSWSKAPSASRPDTVLSYLSVNPGDPFDPSADQPVAEDAVRHRSVRRRLPAPRRRHPDRAGGRKPDHQPHRIRRQQAHQRRDPGARRSSCGRASSIPGPRSRTTCGGSSSSTGVPAASPPPSSRRSSSWNRTASTWCSRSPRGRSPASRRSTSSATSISATAS